MSTLRTDKLPAPLVFGRLEPNGPGPTHAEEFEHWEPDDDNPMELIGGWVLPMGPGNFQTGKRSVAIAAVLLPRVRANDWSIASDARHRLPSPADTVVFPDLAIHTVADPQYLPGTESIGRIPELVIEILSKKTHERDMAPHGAKFLAYQMSGVREYYYAWPDGRDAAGWRLEGGVYVPAPSSPDGFYRSALLGCELRLVEPATRG